MSANQQVAKTVSDRRITWEKVARLMLTSRAIDDLEEQRLVPGKQILYQFSARGHELVQILLGMQLTHRHDGISAYYRSRPLMLSLGVDPEEALASSMAKKGGYSNGRDIGVVCNRPGIDGKPTVLPMAGDVGAQYTPAVGWAQAIRLYREEMGLEEYERAIAAVFGGDGSVASNGFWSAITIATTQHLPILFCIEDNGYGLSVPSDFQTPGGNIAKNLYSFKNLRIFDGDGTDPGEAKTTIKAAVQYVREGKGPVLLHLSVPRLTGHSYQDNQAYKEEAVIQQERKHDPLKNLKTLLVPEQLSNNEWESMEREIETNVERAARAAENREESDPPHTQKYAFGESREDGSDDLQMMGGVAPGGHTFPDTSRTPRSKGTRVNMVEAIHRTLDYELETNEKLLVFGEDVGAKGGVHAATTGLQKKYGKHRVFDTSLSEEGIVGRAAGLAYAGFMPVAEIQFRKYADPATEQLKNCGMVRWRTDNKFAAPMVVRMAGGFAKSGDPWHSESFESFFIHTIGWQVAMPGNAQDAAGLLRSAMRGNNPTIFFEHRYLMDAPYARRPYPGDQFVVPFGELNKLQEGGNLTVVTWGAMCERCEEAAKKADISADILDLRTLMPWDKEGVISSVRKTNRCLIVHEDTRTAGFGAEISAVLNSEAFQYLDAPIERLTMPDIPLPYNAHMLKFVLPDVDKIIERMRAIIQF